MYMDYGAGKPVDKRVLKAMNPYFLEDYGNASSGHSYGNAAKEALTSSREKVAQLIGAEKAQEIIFTSGGTESNNLAIKGAAFRNKSKGNHIITTAIEHMSVINICKYLQKEGFEVTAGKFPFGANGRALALNATDGFVKLVSRKSDGLLLGAQIVGQGASDMIAELGLAIEAGMTVEDIAMTIHAHPTLGEISMEAAEVVMGHPIHILSK